MTVTSLPFLLFVGAAFLVYHLLPRRLQNYWLLLLSYAFVFSWDWTFALVLAGSTLVNYGLALRLVQNGQPKKPWLWVGIVLNISLLLVFRLADFFLPGLTALANSLGWPLMSDGLQILIPLGLSYYVLGNISYLVDVYRRQMTAATDLLDFALYLAYFPKLIAGPIERAQSFLPKLAQPRMVDIDLFSRSVLLIFVGLFRKLFIADILNGSLLWDLFQMPSKYTPTELLIWLLVYSFAIYNDFAGYSSIVRGISGLFGIELNANFRVPYFSRSFTEFWTRWHISLSEWLRDYIYFPLSRVLLRRDTRRQSAVNLIVPPLVTMLMSGLWHGFGLHMLLWGAMHAVYQIMERVLAIVRPGRQVREQPLLRQAVSMLVVFGFVIMAWVPFRWELPAAFEFWGALFNWSSFDIRYRRMFLLLPIVFISLVLDLVQAIRQDEFIFLKWPKPVQAGLMAVVIVLVIIMTSGDFEQPFVYQAF